MSSEAAESKRMGLIGRIIGIFTSPKEAFHDINKKPDWLIPFLILIVVVTAVQFVLMDIGLADQLAKLEARDMPEAQMEMARQQMQGSLKYIQFVVIPIMTLLTWCVVAGIHLLFTNVLFGGETTFKKMFAVTAWSSLISVVAVLLRMLLVLSKGTSYGVTTSLAILLPTPGLTESPSLLFKLLAHVDIFAIWGLILTAIGISEISKLDINKAATVVAIIWLIWVLISILLWGVFGSFVLGY